LHRDRDRTYSETFRRRVASMGIAEAISAPTSPWQNAYAERVIGSIRRECLDHVIVLNQAHLRRALTAYSRYYHRSRTHLGLEKDAPNPRRVSATSTGPIIAIRKSAVFITATNGRPRKGQVCRLPCSISVRRKHAPHAARFRQQIVVQRELASCNAIRPHQTRSRT
jgi:integrase-like protein